ncbi:MAG TPA: DUF6323 family protein [Mobilitalea sp.]|nr:DUF6323 family protein [Mobilitalea sp.]
MNDNFMLLPISILNQHTLMEVRKCNDLTEQYYLTLSDQDIGLLMENRKETLESNGRIEFGGGVIQKIIIEFADSPYMYQDSYVSTLMELQECFYYFKNESLEQISDDSLIRQMKLYYDNVCQGSVEFLRTTILENISRDIRYGKEIYRDSDGYEDDYTAFLECDPDEMSGKGRLGRRQF